MHPKFDIGHSVKVVNEEQEMLVITVIADGDYSGNSALRPPKFNGKYKCAWIREREVILRVFDESELTSV